MPDTPRIPQPEPSDKKAELPRKDPPPEKPPQKVIEDLHVEDRFESTDN